MIMRTVAARLGVALFVLPKVTSDRRVVVHAWHSRKEVTAGTNPTEDCHLISF
jgi:hypothetical protein